MSNDYAVSKIIGNKITHYRKMNGMTLDELSKIIGVSEQQQSRYERGVNRINVDRLYQYSMIFNIDISVFFNFNLKNLNLRINKDEKEKNAPNY